MLLRPQYLQELRKGDQIQSCESCQRILYYAPPVEDLTGEAASVR
jgi:predicted  nucleic acid-binding Zn-ribbon protein